VAVGGNDDLPDALKQLVQAWRKEGVSLEEMVARIDALELLAREERETLVALARDGT
jgi:hypothetical protein